MTHRRALRVAAVIDTWFVSGPGRQLAALAQALSHHNVQLRIFMFQRDFRPVAPFIRYLEAQGVDHVVLRDRGPFDLKVPQRLAKALAAFDPDIVQSHGYRPTSFVALLARTRPRWSWIGYFHGDTAENLKVRAYNALNRVLLPLADRVVVLSRVHQTDFARHSDKVRLIHNASLALPEDGPPVDLSACRKAGQPLVAVVARLSPEKGVDLLLDALAILHERQQPVTLIIAGDGPSEPALRRQAQNPTIHDNVFFLGRVENVLSIYRQVDLVVIPSRAGAEGLPNVLLESLRQDTPVVATAVAAVPEVLADEQSGTLVAPGSAQALASGLALGISTLHSATARRARARACRAFSLERRTRLHLQLYEELVPQFALERVNAPAPQQ